MEYDDLEFDNEDVDYDNDDYDDIYDEFGEVKDVKDKKDDSDNENEEVEEEEDYVDEIYEMENSKIDKKYKVVPRKQRTCSRQMSNFEYDRLNGILTELINTTDGSPESFKVHPLVFKIHKEKHPDKELSSSLDIAEFWLENCKIIPFPVILRRFLSKNICEEWLPMEMILPTELDTNYMFDEEIDDMYEKIKETYKQNMQIFA